MQPRILLDWRRAAAIVAVLSAAVLATASPAWAGGVRVITFEAPEPENRLESSTVGLDHDDAPDRASAANSSTPGTPRSSATDSSGAGGGGQAGGGGGGSSAQPMRASSAPSTSGSVGGPASGESGPASAGESRGTGDSGDASGNFGPGGLGGGDPLGPATGGGGFVPPPAQNTGEPAINPPGNVPPVNIPPLDLGVIDLQDELHDLFDDPAPQAVQRPSDPMATFAPAATTDAPEASSVLMWLGLAAVGAYGAKKRLRAA